MPNDAPTPRRPRERSSSKPHAPGRSSEERWIVGFLLFCGAIPWLGCLLLGSWDERELGISAVVLVFTLRSLFRGRTSRGTTRALPAVGEHAKRAADDPSRPFMRTRWTSHT